ncbi:hypothetical protein IAR50_005145 [Cryptococcus sp. DSM 104548]
MTTVPKHMKALLVPQPGSDREYYDLQNVPTPTPRATQVLIRLRASGLCHTDSIVRDGSFGANWPLVGGHEPAGEIVAQGSSASGLSVGDRVVALLPRDPCGECPDCTLGDWKYCKKSNLGGINADGYFSEYAVVEAKFCVPLPANMTFEQAAPLSCAGVTVYAGIKKAGLKAGDVVAISGLGGLGYLGVQIAKALGLKVVAIDARPEPLSLVRGLQSQLRPDIIVDASSTKAEDIVQAIRTLRSDGYAGWEGVDASVLTSPAPSSYGYAATLTRSHGLLVLLAQPPKLEFEYPLFLAKDLTLKGSLHGNEVDLKETVELCAKFSIKSDVKTFTVDQHEQMLDEVEGDNWKGKAVLLF